MITSVQGSVIAINDRTITLSVGPLGVDITLPHTGTLSIGSSITLQTYLHWHQEQGFSLFGFFTSLERTLFLTIIDCSGIGPKLALALLEQLTPESLVNGVQADDKQLLATVPGIGIKKAEHLLVQLRHKLPKILEKHPLDPASKTHDHWHTVAQVLDSLQYGKNEINSAIFHAKTNIPSSHSFDLALRKALQFLSKT